MPDEPPTPVELPFQPSLTLPGATGTPFPTADAPAPPWKMLPTSPSPAGDRWMNIFHGDETWQGRWPAENDQLLSMMDDPAELKMASANALWIADRLGESHDAVTRAYPMALGLTSLQLLGHMDGTDRDVYDAIRRSLVPDLTPEEVAQVKAAPLSLAQYYLPDLVDEENRVPELDESRAYFQLGQFPLNLPTSQHEEQTPLEIELLGRTRWAKSLEQKGTPAPQHNGNLASDIVMSFLGGMTESTVTMMQGPRFFGDKVADFIPGYEGSFLDKWTNSEIAALQWLRESAQDSYGVDPEFAQSYAGELTNVLGASVPQMLSMLLPPLAATMIGGQSFQYAWEDAENTARRLGQPFNRNRAFAYALTMGAVNAAMTMVKFDLVVKPWLNTGGRAVVNNAFKFLRTTLLGTTATVGQGMLNDALASGFGIEFRNPLDLERRKHDALLGTGASVVLSLSGMTLARPRQETPQPPPEKPAVTLDQSLGKQEVPPPLDLPRPEVISHEARPDSFKIPEELGKLTSVPQKLPGPSIGLGDHFEFDALIWKQGDEVVVRVNMIKGEGLELFGLLRKAKEIAKLNSADTVRFESFLANDDLEAILAKRYGMISREKQINGKFDVFTLSVK